MSAQISIDDLKTQLLKSLRVANKYRGFIFFLVLSSLYGFIIWRINVLSNAPPSQADIQKAEQSVSAAPRLDEASAKAITSLKDNSVRVQTLFESARNNPFDE